MEAIISSIVTAIVELYRALASASGLTPEQISDRIRIEIDRIQLQQLADEAAEQAILTNTEVLAEPAPAADEPLAVAPDDGSSSGRA